MRRDLVVPGREYKIMHVNKQRRPLSSVLSDGIYAAEVHTDNAPDYYPIARPHYE